MNYIISENAIQFNHVGAQPSSSCNSPILPAMDFDERSAVQTSTDHSIVDWISTLLDADNEDTFCILLHRTQNKIQ